MQSLLPGVSWKEEAPIVGPERGRACGKGPYAPTMAMAPTHAFVGLAIADLAAGRYADTRIRVAAAR